MRLPPTCHIFMSTTADSSNLEGAIDLSYLHTYY